MKQLYILGTLVCFWMSSNAQNVGINTTTPQARLTVKSSSLFDLPFLIKNEDNDTLMWSKYNSVLIGGNNNIIPNSAMIIANKFSLQFDEPHLDISATGEYSSGSVNGSVSSIKFSNIHSNSGYFLSGYAGADFSRHSFSLGYGLESAFTNKYLLHFNNKGFMGVATFNPTAAVQINHRATAAAPTLLLMDSATGGSSTVQFKHMGNPAGFWKISGKAPNAPGGAAYFDIETENGIKMTVDHNGNLGVGVVGPTEKIDVNGNIKLTGELNRGATSTSNLVPICYGNVNATGSINITASTSNFTVTKTSTGFYEIAITGETYSFGNYTTLVTPTSSTAPILMGIGSGSGRLQVRTWNLSGTAVDNQFTFMVYKE